MTKEQRAALLTHLADRQSQGGTCGTGTAPLTVQIGYVSESNMVKDDGIVILNAPPTLVYEVIDWIRGRENDAPFISASMVDYQSGPVSRTRGLLVR